MMPDEASNGREKPTALKLAMSCQSENRVGVNMTEVNCDSQARIALPYLGNCQTDQSGTKK